MAHVTKLGESFLHKASSKAGHGAASRRAGAATAGAGADSTDALRECAREWAACAGAAVLSAALQLEVPCNRRLDALRRACRPTRR
jgi:hypothetical protein